MKIQFTHYSDRGIANRERVHFRVNTAVDVGFFVVLSTAVSAPGKVASGPRDVFWFPSTQVSVGDEVVLYTGSGKHTSQSRPEGGAVHVFYWERPMTMWNNVADCIVVMEVNEWMTALPAS